MMKSDVFLKSNNSKSRKIIAAVSFLFMLVVINVLTMSRTFGNGLVISNVTYVPAGSTVSFDITWNNSWRNTAASPNNWDAAWVFVKFRDCTAANSVSFTHGLVSTALSDHTFSGTTILEPTMRDGTVGIDASPNNTGVMLRNTIDPAVGTVTATVTLKITNLPASGVFDMRVNGIEMVFAPQNPYFLGDGNSLTITSGAFAPAVSSLFPFLITSDGAQSVFENSTIICPAGTCALTAPFPKGYNSFYIMKYEITQGQYAEFLNATNSLTQTIHYQNFVGSNRYTITNTGTPPSQYAASRPDRACNYLSWSDFSTFLDWAALRPVTELEYEKACRGTNICVPGEYAWGSTVTTRAATISGTEDGTETITTTNANVNDNYINIGSPFTGGDVGQGPLRSGIFATPSTSTRQQTGMSFYGAMDLSGNINEYCISALAGTSSGSSATGVSLGDGNLDPVSGNMDVSNWPNATAPPSNNIIFRGNGWYSSNTTSTVSYRSLGSASTRQQDSGGRGGR